MGNKASISISLHHEPGALRAGNVLRGQVVVHVTRGKLLGQRLWLDTVGKENACVKGHRTEHEIIHVSAALIDLRGKVLRTGIHEYPFSLQMPESLPSSMTSSSSRDHSDRHGCKIEYNISARLVDLTCDKTFSIQSAPTRDGCVPFSFGPTTQNVKSAGVWDVGTVTFGANVMNTHVSRGEEIEISLAAINNSTVDLKAEIKIIQIVEWKGPNKKEIFDTKYTLVEHSDVLLPGLQIGKCSKKEARIDSESNRRKLNHAEVVTKLHCRENVITLKIPHSALDTYKGELINISHYIKFKLVTRRLVDNAATKIPICIGTPETPVMEIYPHPANDMIVPSCPIESHIAPSTYYPADTEEASAHDEEPFVLGGSIMTDGSNLVILPPPAAPILSNY